MYEDGERPEQGIRVANIDNEKKVRREIANSNERRRMQSINAGFQSLRTLLPHHEGEKLSKASILQQTAEYIYSLEQEKTRLLSQNCQLKRLLSLSQQQQKQHQLQQQQQSSSLEGGDSPQIKKKRFTTEGVEISDPLEDVVGVTSIDAETSLQLLQERRLRQQLEAKLQTLESELLSTRVIQRTVVEPVIQPKKETKTEEVTTARSEESALTTTTVLLKDDRLSVDPSITIPGGSSNLPQTIYLKGTAPIEADIKTGVKVEKLPRVLDPVSFVQTKPDTSEQIVSTDPLGQRSYIVTTNNSRQNLDSIVEAIRHLEGDHLFSSEEVGGNARGGETESSSEDPPHRVIKEEVVESVPSLEVEKSSSSSSCEIISTDVPSSTRLSIPVSSNNIIILKQCPSEIIKH